MRGACEKNPFATQHCWIDYLNNTPREKGQPQNKQALHTDGPLELARACVEMCPQADVPYYSKRSHDRFQGEIKANGGIVPPNWTREAQR